MYIQPVVRGPFRRAGDRRHCTLCCRRLGEVEGWWTSQRLVAGVEAEGWRFVAFVRLVPLFPFNLLNYALGLTQIPLTQYILASLVCMAPGTLAYAWLGYAGREALADNRSAINYALIALALLAAVALLPRLVRRLRGDHELSGSR